MKNMGYNIDFKKEVITITTHFREKASVINSKEYKEFCQLRKDYSDFQFKYAPKSNSKKETYKGLTITFIEEYIQAHDDCNTLVAELNKTKELYKELNNGKAATYPQIKQWFINTFPDLTSEEIQQYIEAKKATITFIEDLEKKAKKEKRKKAFKKIFEPNNVAQLT